MQLCVANADRYPFPPCPANTLDYGAPVNCVSRLPSTECSTSRTTVVRFGVASRLGNVSTYPWFAPRLCI